MTIPFKPNKPLESPEIVLDGAEQVTVTPLQDYYSCSCVKWRGQVGRPLNCRTCKHLKEWLGEEFEKDRLAWAGGQIAKTPMVIRRPTLNTAKSPIQQIQQAAKYPEPHLLLAQKWLDTQNVEGYWISEKLDGVRAYYDHKHRVFLSRMGNVYHAPAWFSEGYPPDMALDGEFYMGRQTFQQTQQIIKDPNSPKWDQLKFYVFDSPNHTGPFEERHEALVNYFNSVKTTAVVMTHEVCKGRDHVYELLKHYESLGGEGVMLRKPKSHYVGKRSASLLKVKSFYDAEARVEEVIPGKGKYTGMMGALQCSMASGLSFKIGTGYSDKDRVTPPRVGSIITYRFQELSSEGIPKFPAFVAERIDATEPRDADIPAHKRGRAGDDEE